MMFLWKREKGRGLEGRRGQNRRLALLMPRLGSEDGPKSGFIGTL